MTLRTTTTAALIAVAAGLLMPIAEPASAAPTAARPCTTMWQVTQKTPVRRPAPQDGPVATMRSPIHHYLHKGDVVPSCVIAIARTESGPAYQACGGPGSIWRIVPGGQVPQTCLKRV
ncbi:hypothetical protein [Streptomyces sasae]|uniref:hypothetical protein n=1 Tax=Streptomyces sasae TaxID=1266772 RepID=UPI00292D793C|nr:hypothetical protein [Streptomyces sasae]